MPPLSGSLPSTALKSKRMGYIVMEFIEGVVCSTADARLVAPAVQFLITIKGPTAQPGPIATPSSSTANQRLWSTNRGRSVPEVEKYGLRLCLSDMNQTNFVKDRENKIVALDFGATCFLPVSFFELALHNHDPFTHVLRQLIVHPTSTQSDASSVASGCLVPYDTNNLGLPREMRAKTAARARRRLTTALRDPRFRLEANPAS
ncbi:hypothetical protein OE88DRAFT_1735546 [Heliocybe sulcata]|uniref:Uncharacterized protein n=1 Tax=Heliocybe sulcata TaxID=5364 RepID=A0A5C3MZZ8_9AGAM|nr:hypothetical protein OE88DRAFT_1735546 [Heliocybe sulcata]